MLADLLLELERGHACESEAIISFVREFPNPVNTVISVARYRKQQMSVHLYHYNCFVTFSISLDLFLHPERREYV